MNDKSQVQFGYKRRSSNWTSLRLLNIFRVSVAAIFFAQSFLSSSPLIYIHNLSLYAWTSFAYLLLSLVMTLAAWIERRNFQLQVTLQTYIDIIAIVLLMHACGGISSGLGMLLIISIAISGLLGKNSLATIFASLASVLLLSEYSYTSFYSISSGSSTQVGLLGAALFATALVTQTLTKRISSSEAVIKQQKLDVANLAALNSEILQNMQSGVIALDSHDQVRHINDIARNMLQINDDIKIPFSLRQQLPEIYQSLKHWHDDISESKILLPTQNGDNNIQVYFQDMHSTSHKGTLIFLDDVSKIKHQMQQSKLASLGQLTANIAHEIRNPLAAISHAAQLMTENEDLPDMEKRLTQIVSQHSDRINDIIEDIMQLSRGSVPSQDKIILNVWIQHFIDAFCLTGENKQECFDLQIESEQLEVIFDSGHLSRILTNLCSNAKHHSNSDAPITIRISQDDHQITHIEVADRGKAISNAQMDKIFEPFYTTSSKGSGLGLYIVSQLCELNGAQIKVTRNEYGGTSFIISK
jgi:two-component system, NtrC family, sensor histidine kinase PilS